MEILNNPSLLGFDAGRLSNIDGWMQRYVDERKFAGSSLLVARFGQPVYFNAVGQRSMARGEAFTDDTLVRIYSMTKPVTSVALMMLVEKGLLHLDAPVSRFLPEFSQMTALVPGAERIDQTEDAPAPTIHQLLTHTSGLSYAFNGGVLGEAYTDGKIEFLGDHGTLASKVSELAAYPLAFQPGSKWQYSVAIDVIGRVVEVVSGKGFDQFLHDEIFEPLGMTDTAFSVPEEKLNRFADCYYVSEEDSLTLMDDATRSTFHENHVTCFGGGGGLVSTIADYFKFAEMLRGDGEYEGVRLLSPRITQYMKRNHLGCDIAAMGVKTFMESPMEGVGFGLGGSVVMDPGTMKMPGNVGDFSWGGMASTFFWIDPVDALTVILFTQLVPSSTYPARAELKALVHAALTGE